MIDGQHRLLAHKLERRELIAADVQDGLETSKEIWWESLGGSNATAGLQFSLKEKRGNARKGFGWKTIAELAAKLSVTEQSVRNWVHDLQDLEDFEHHLRAMAAYLTGEIASEIGKQLAVDQKTIANWMTAWTEARRKKPKDWDFLTILASTDGDATTQRKQELIQQYLGAHLLDPSRPPPSLQVFDVWCFSQPDPHYGSEGYPGRLTGQILENLLWYYTDVFNNVYDPFAGSGTTYDVCRAMFRHCWSSDIRPYDVLKGIRQHDITSGPPDFFPKGYKMDLVFLDPPAWHQHQGEASDDATTLATLDLAAFYTALGHVLTHCQRILRPGGVLALFIGPTHTPAGVIDHLLAVSRLCDERGYVYEDRVVVPYTHPARLGGGRCDGQRATDGGDTLPGGAHLSAGGGAVTGKGQVSSWWEVPAVYRTLHRKVSIILVLRIRRRIQRRRWF